MSNLCISETLRAFMAYACEAGRSSYFEIELPQTHWASGVAEDEMRPAASLLKLPLAMAAEAAMTAGHIDSSGSIPIDLLLRDADAPSILERLDSDHRLSPREIIGIAISASDGPCARWLLRTVGSQSVAETLDAIGCRQTKIEAAMADDAGSLVGETTCREAVGMLRAAADSARYPCTANALRRSIRNSRIPLGANDLDVQILHKTGSLTGVAHDVALLECVEGRVWAAFLTEQQHDTLITGYAMGICTRHVLQAWGLAVQRTSSAVEG